jgi:hypothetical protein
MKRRGIRWEIVKHSLLAKGGRGQKRHCGEDIFEKGHWIIAEMSMSENIKSRNDNSFFLAGKISRKR